MGKSKREQSNLTTPNNNGQGGDTTELNKSLNNNLLNVSSMLDISGLSAFALPEEQAGARLSLGAPSELGQSLMPYLSVE